MPRLLIFSLLLAVTAPALASDGVLEINQTCATQTGCFAGDTAGWPVTITVPGSYRLTSNLRLSTTIFGSQSENFIDVVADNVSIDLGGFVISCSTTLGGSCSGNVDGISAVTPTHGVSVRNGSITGMARHGVVLDDQSEVSELRVGRDGVDGIFVSQGSTVSGSTAYENGQYGIFGGSPSTIQGNTAFGNGSKGIFVGNGSTVSDNTAYQNGSHGIHAEAGSTVQGNTMFINTGYGLVLTVNAGYRGNVITNNTMGTVIGGVNAGDNVCNGSLTCP